MSAPRKPPGKGRPPPYAPPGFYDRLRVALVRGAGSDAPGWQAEAARRLGLSRALVCGWANKRQPPCLTSLAAIVRLSGLNAHWMMFGTGPMEAPDAAPDAAERDAA